MFGPGQGSGDVKRPFLSAAIAFHNASEMGTGMGTGQP